MAAAAILEAAIFDSFEPEIAPLDPPSPEPNMDWIGRPVAKIWRFEFVTVGPARIFCRPFRVERSNFDRSFSGT